MSISQNDDNEQRLSVVVMLSVRHAEHMFLLQCPACGQRELRSTSALSSFANTARGIEMVIGCSRCGTAVHTITGVRAGAPTVGCAASTVPSPTGAAA